MRYKSLGEPKGRSILAEIFQENDRPCNSGACRCDKCNTRRQANNTPKILQEVQQLGWELNRQEEYELSKAFEKIKSFARRSYNKAKPWIATADIIRRLVSPPVDPLPVMKDVATYVEQDRIRKREEAIEKASIQQKNNFRQKPDPEVSLLQEIFMENEIARTTLRYGSRGRDVVYLQQKLNYHYASIIPLKEDGMWGQKTHAAVLSFQKSRRLAVDGVVGSKTWAALEQGAQPLIVPVSCSIPQQGLFSEISSSSPPLPAKSKFRTCCLLAPPTSFTPDFGDPKNLATHNAPNEVVSLIYTGKAGFIDLGHVRDIADLTKFVYDQLVSGRGYTSPIITTEGETKLLKCPADLLRTARAISFDDSVAHEIVSYRAMMPGGHNSSFSPEDLCSNNLGSIVAERAILSMQKSATPKSFNIEVTNILNTVINDLDAQSPAESQKAFNRINGKWIKFSNVFSLQDNAYLKRRNFEIIPWKVGHASDGATPGWLLNSPASDPSLYKYTCIGGSRRFDNRQFSKEIAAVKTDAAARYGSDFDKP